MVNNYNGWYVLYVKSLHEKKIYNLLLEENIDAFLPLVEVVKQWSDRKKKLLKPLFPSYIFVNIHSSLEFYKVLDLYGVYKYIRFGSEYAKVPIEEINKVKLLVGNKEVSNLETNVKLPRIGEIKKINLGPLNGMECEVMKVNNARKIIVRINSLQQNIMATVPSYYFEDALVKQ